MRFFPCFDPANHSNHLISTAAVRDCEPTQSAAPRPRSRDGAREQGLAEAEAAGPGGVRGAEAGELLAVFDAVRAEYEGVAAERFNDDVTYMVDINRVRECWREGSGGRRVTRKIGPWVDGTGDCTCWSVSCGGWGGEGVSSGRGSAAAVAS